MKAVILAAGEGSRLRPLTNTTPKPLIKIFGKSILEHNLENIYKSVLEINIIIKYKGDLIQKTLGNSYKGVPIKYITQNNNKGTAAAIQNIESDLDMLILNGDSIFEKSELKKIIEYPGYGALVKEVQNPEKYGIYQVDSENNVREIVEKPELFIGNLANLGVYKFNSKIIELANNVPLSTRGEYEITDAINEFVKIHPFKAIVAKKDFIDVGYPWDILTSNKYFLDKLKTSVIKGEIEENVTIKGNIVLEEGAILKSGTYIEGNVYIGKNAKIGPNTYLRNGTVIGEGSKVGNAVELKNTTVGDNTSIAHLSYFGDSVIGNNVNIGGGFISANLRHDSKNIRIPVKGELVDSGMRKFGIIIGDNCKTGINTSSMPGRVLENDHFTNPGTIIK